MLQLIFVVITLLVLPSVLLSHVRKDLRLWKEYRNSQRYSVYLLRVLGKAAAFLTVGYGYGKLIRWQEQIDPAYLGIGLTIAWLLLYAADVLGDLFYGSISNNVRAAEDFVEEHWRGLIWMALVVGAFYLFTPDWETLFNNTVGLGLDLLVAVWHWSINTLQALLQTHGWLMLLAATIPWTIVAWLARANNRRYLELESREYELKALGSTKRVLVEGYEALREDIQNGSKRSRTAQEIRQLIEYLQEKHVGKSENPNDVQWWRACIAEFRAQRAKPKQAS